MINPTGQALNVYEKEIYNKAVEDAAKICDELNLTFTAKKIRNLKHADKEASRVVD